MMSDKKIRQVVTGFLINKELILILKRSQKVGTYQGKWAGVSGSIEIGNTPLEQIYTELEEETGLTREDLILIKVGTPLEITDPELDFTWKVFPFLFEIKETGKIKIDWEHTRYKWVKPEKLKEPYRRIWLASKLIYLNTIENIRQRIEKEISLWLENTNQTQFNYSK